MNAGAATVLERILAETRAEVERRKREVPLDEERLTPPEPTRGKGRFRAALRAPGIGVIAEFKRRSPSAGAMHDAPDLLALLSAYRSGGAVAISILTEGPNFGGALEDLLRASAACELPLLRKDFIVDHYQLLEARAAGADAVLLIVAALDAQQLSSLYDAAHALGLDVLVEVHSREELQTALSIEADIVGINNRDLRDFSVDVERTGRLMADIPAGVTVVSESGIATADQLERLHESGVHAALVGESLMRSSDPAAMLAGLTSFRRAEGAL